MLPGKLKMAAVVLLAVGLAPGPAPAAGPVKTNPEPEKLVRQLGSSNFAQRQAAEKALRSMGAKAAAAVRAGVGNADLEIARRCEAVWPRLWETEIARPDVERLAGYAHPLWVRFRKSVGDDPSSRALFAEMVADLRRFTRLESAEADPDKAGEVYAAELNLRVEALKAGYRQAEAAARGRTGFLWPSSGIPTRGEFAALLFLGTYPSTAAVTLREDDDWTRVSHHNVFGLALHPNNRKKHEAIPPALRRLFAAWLARRTDPNPIQFGMNLGVYHAISEVAPAARVRAADAALAPRARGFALLAVGRFGSPADLPLLSKAFADTRIFHTTNYTSEGGQKRPVETLVSDVAVAAALRVCGQHPADFGFPLLAMYKERSPETLAKYHLLGFFDGASRQAAHKKARDWLNEQPKPPPAPPPRAPPAAPDTINRTMNEGSTAPVSGDGLPVQVDRHLIEQGADHRVTACTTGRLRQARARGERSAALDKFDRLGTDVFAMNEGRLGERFQFLTGLEQHHDLGVTFQTQIGVGGGAGTGAESGEEHDDPQQTEGDKHKPRWPGPSR